MYPAANLSPFAAVLFAGSRIALILVVPGVNNFLMRLAVSAGYQLRAAGIAAEHQRFMRHGCASRYHKSLSINQTIIYVRG